MSLRSNKIVPSPISGNIDRTSTKQNNSVKLYYSKFQAIYYIDLMYNYMDVITTSCIAILDRINYFDRTIHNISNTSLFLKSRNENDLEFLHKKINNNRYVYVEKHYDIIDVNAEKEVLAINFLERKRELSDFTNGNYYRELYNVINKKNTVQTQFKDISHILNNTNFDDDIKKQKIQEYINKKNKRLASNINSKLNYIPLESLENKLKFINENLILLEKLFIDIWTTNGKKSFDEYKQYKINKRTGSIGGKRKRYNRKIKGSGLLGNFFSKFVSKKVGIIPIDYIGIVNNYKKNHIDKLKNIYGLIEEIILFFYHLINITHEEYSYLNKPNNSYLTTERGVSKKIRLNNQEKNYLEMLKFILININNIKHNFRILKGRYTEFDKILSTSFSD
jgi:hypothetical protein